MSEVRALVHAADPEVAETIKRSKPPYFVLDGNICSLLAAKGWPSAGSSALRSGVRRYLVTVRALRPGPSPQLMIRSG